MNLCFSYLFIHEFGKLRIMCGIPLISYLNANNILDTQQSVIRKLQNTETNILLLLDDLLKSSDNDLLTLLLLLYLYPVFDIINLDLLIFRLKLIGHEDNVLLWFSNNITNITYSTKINKLLSPKCKFIFGVPQGMPLSPILLCIYLLMLSKLIKSFPSVKYYIYAEDIEIHAYYHLSSNIHLRLCLTTTNNFPQTTIYYLTLIHGTYEFITS